MLVISYFGKMPDFVNFEAVDDSNVDGIHDPEEILAESVSDVEFIDDENVYDENITDYYAFTNVGTLMMQCKILLLLLVIHKKLITIVQKIMIRIMK